MGIQAHQWCLRSGEFPMVLYSGHDLFMHADTINLSFYADITFFLLIWYFSIPCTASSIRDQENDTACEYSFKNLFWKQTPNIKSFRNLQTIKCAFVTSCHLIFSSSRRRIIKRCFEHMDSSVFFILDIYSIISVCDIHCFGRLFKRQWIILELKSHAAQWDVI